MQILKWLNALRHNESGKVTVDWIALTIAIIGLISAMTFFLSEWLYPLFQ